MRKYLRGAGPACAIATAIAALHCGEATPYAAEPVSAPMPLVSTPRVARPAVPANVVVPAPPPTALSEGAPAPTSPAASRATVEHPEALKRFFDVLMAIEDGAATDDARIMQIGDSHTAADWQTGVVRRLLQARFGDGGRGFVAIGKPWKGYVQDGIRVGMAAGCAAEHARLVKGRLVGDGFYGLTGVAVGCRGAEGHAWLDVPDAERIDLAYVQQPGGGAFDFVVDGANVVRVSTRGEHALHSRGLDVEPSSHRIEVRTSGSSPVRFLGAALDRKTKGVVLDSYGRDGARAANLLHWNAEHFAEVLKWRNPSLVMLAFGTNECGDKDISNAMLERDLAEVVGRIIRATPNASCLILGPPDYVQYGPEGAFQHPRLAEVVAVQKRVADAAHCAFYDQITAMGGPGAHAAWAQENPPRARRDGVHLSRDGYSALAAGFVDELVRAYSTYRTEQRKAPAPGLVAKR